MTALFQTYGVMLLKAIGIHTVYVLAAVGLGFWRDCC